MSAATSTTLGEIVLSGDLTGSASVPALRASGVTPGNYTPQKLYVDAKGRITSIGSVDASVITSILPNASSSVLGAVKIGANINVAGDGTISIGNASYSTLGVFSLAGGLIIDASGKISADFSYLQVASTTNAGVMRAGSGFSVSSDGNLAVAVDVASTGSFGLCRPGTGMRIYNGQLYATGELADNSTAGAVLPANSNNLTITAGDINVGANIPQKNTANTFTAAQTVSPTVISLSTTSLVIDGSTGGNFIVSTTSPFDFAAPTNLIAGGIYPVIVTNSSGSGMTVGFNVAIKNKGSFSLANGETKIVTLIKDATNTYALVTAAYL